VGGLAPSPKLRASGAIAQLGERLLCKQEVTGSIPVGSISLTFAGDFWITRYFAVVRAATGCRDWNVPIYRDFSSAVTAWLRGKRSSRL
jgi:hypothetical protein